jgi:hypothetical protein
VIVLDRPTDDALRGAEEYTKLMGSSSLSIVEIPGQPRWLGPARAWNAGFAEAAGELYYCISSEVIQAPQNVKLAREISAISKSVIFGKCENSTARQLVVGAPPGLLVSSKMPRPLGFIACLPADNVREIGGFDEAFMGTPEKPNYWHDDDDFYLRMWRSGLDFIFDDAISGIHLDHSRPVLDTPEGKAGIIRNREIMQAKHGTVHPWNDLLRVERFMAGRTLWEHV